MIWKLGSVVDPQVTNSTSTRKLSSRIMESSRGLYCTAFFINVITLSVHNYITVTVTLASPHRHYFYVQATCARVANLWSRGASTRSTSETWLPMDPVESAEVLRQNTISKGTRADTRGVVSIAYLELRIHAVATQYLSSVVPVTPRTRG
jgi:hypothetical protein